MSKQNKKRLRKKYFYALHKCVICGGSFSEKLSCNSCSNNYISVTIDNNLYNPDNIIWVHYINNNFYFIIEINETNKSENFGFQIYEGSRLNTNIRENKNILPIYQGRDKFISFFKEFLLFL